MTETDTPAAETPAPLAGDELRLIDGYWRAANYLSVAQIYLLDNPFLREPLRSEHVKPRLLGHFGTVPGLNLVYVPPCTRRAPSPLGGGPPMSGATCRVETAPCPCRRALSLQSDAPVATTGVAA